MGLSPMVVTFQAEPFSNSMIMGERVKKADCTVDGPEMLLQFSLVVYSEKDTIFTIYRDLYIATFLSPHF